MRVFCMSGDSTGERLRVVLAWACGRGGMVARAWFALAVRLVAARRGGLGPAVGGGGGGAGGGGFGHGGDSGAGYAGGAVLHPGVGHGFAVADGGGGGSRAWRLHHGRGRRAAAGGRGLQTVQRSAAARKKTCGSSRGGSPPAVWLDAAEVTRPCSSELSVTDSYTVYMPDYPHDPKYPALRRYAKGEAPLAALSHPRGRQHVTSELNRLLHINVEGKPRFTVDDLEKICQDPEQSPATLIAARRVLSACRDPRRYVKDKHGNVFAAGSDSEPGRDFDRIVDRLEGKPTVTVEHKGSAERTAEQVRSELAGLVARHPELMSIFQMKQLESENAEAEQSSDKTDN